jgi:hypothetical protein
MGQGDQISATRSWFCCGSTPVSVSAKRMIWVISLSTAPGDRESGTVVEIALVRGAPGVRPVGYISSRRGSDKES